MKRSRGGCENCKRAKVKCDERRPSCGTCFRRGKHCIGYLTRTKPLRWKEATVQTALEAALLDHQERKQADVRRAARRGEAACAITSSMPATEGTSVLATTTGIRDIFGPPLSRSISPFISDGFSSTVEDGISVYFARHPRELVIGSEQVFVDEMNYHVLSVLQSNSEVFAESLCAIGHMYRHEMGNTSSLSLALNSRAKTLARIREGHELSVEAKLSIFLALMSMELIDIGYSPDQRSFQALQSASSSFVNQFFSTTTTACLSETARYSLRALFRQDMVMALVERRRLRIRPAVWLDEESKTSADRYMGFTMTLMPLIEKLCELAEDFEHFRHDQDGGQPDIEQSLEARGAALRAELEAWRPPLVRQFSGYASQKFLLHSAIVRTSALLYLHRLLHPFGQDSCRDGEALVLAYDVFAHLSPDPQDNRLALLPIFLAACELEDASDRALAEHQFDAIYESRHTFSAQVTKNFVMKRVWKARDERKSWSWMKLVDEFPGECIPI